MVGRWSSLLGPFAYFERRWLLVSGSVYQEKYSNHHDPSIGVSFQPQISGNVSGTVNYEGLKKWAPTSYTTPIGRVITPVTHFFWAI